EEPDLTALYIHDPRQINLLWAAFNASGESRFVEKIISYLDAYELTTITGGGRVAEAAIMTLAANALHHSRVREICQEQQVSNPSPKIRVLLEALLSALNSTGEERGDYAH